MKEFLISLGGVLLAILGWWIKDQPRRMRESRQLKLLEDIKELEHDRDAALLARDMDSIALINKRLRELRTKSRIVTRY